MCNYYNDVDVDAYVGFDNEDNAAMETALATMRKYQQIQEIYKKWFCEDTSAEAYTKISEILKDKEPITKKGHWVIGTCVFYCSECGYEPYSLSDFCPGCGADMREKEEV